MTSKKAMITSAVSSLLAAGTFAVSAQDAAESAHDAPEMEKCFGIVKAGANDCAGPGHTCQGHASTDADPNEFILLPAGTCGRIVGGEAK